MVRDVGERLRSISDVKAFVVRYGDCELVLWVDLLGRQMQGILLNQASIDDTFRALARWSNYLEPSWRARAD